MGNRTRDHPACGIVPQPTTLARAPFVVQFYSKYLPKDNMSFVSSNFI
jgi:hypothetical protein